MVTRHSGLGLGTAKPLQSQVGKVTRFCLDSPRKLLSKSYFLAELIPLDGVVYLEKRDLSYVDVETAPAQDALLLTRFG